MDHDAPASGGFAAIACGLYHNLALHNDGTVVTRGGTSWRQRADAPTGTGFVAIARGSYRLGQC